MALASAALWCALTPAFAQTLPPNPIPSTTFEYDALNRPTKLIKNTGDTPGNPSNPAPVDLPTSYTIDPLGRVNKITDALAGNTSLTLDGQSQVTKVVDPKNLSTSYTVDGLGSATKQISPDTGTTNRVFNDAGLLTSSTDAAGRTATYSYDALNRLLQISYSTAAGATSPATVFEYDGGSNAPQPPAINTALGRLSKITDESGSTQYVYDGLGRLIQKIQTTPPSPRLFKTTYTYDVLNAGSVGNGLGKLTSITYPSFNRFNYSFNSAGQIKAIHLNPSNSNASATNITAAARKLLLGNISYDPFDASNNYAPIAWSWGNHNTVINGSTVSNTYSRNIDTAGRITGYALGHLLTNGLYRNLSYDGANRILGYSHTSLAGAAPAFDQSFNYDNLDRLTSFANAAQTQGYTYDANGNRTSHTVSGTTYAHTIAANSNRLTSTAGPAPARSNLYNLAGDLTKDGSITYTLSPRGRLSSIRIGTATPVANYTVTYLYNGLEQRTRKSGPVSLVPTGKTYYAYDEDNRLIGEYNAQGKTLQETVYLGDLPVITLKQTTTNPVQTSIYYIHSDHINTPRVITQATDNQMVWRWDTAEPFGYTPPDQNPAAQGLFAYNPRFPGQVFDSETNQHYNVNRNYDAQIGRYTQSDPIGLAAGVNTYGYVGGNPVGDFDPLGLAGCIVNFPNYPIDTGFGFSSTNLGGHGGVLSYTNQGSTRYFEFGRYSPSNPYVIGEKRPESDGNVRQVPMPDLVIDPRTGQPTPASLEALRRALSDRAGHKTKADLTCDKDADDKKINQFAIDLANDKNRLPYSWKPWSPNQCRSFASNAFGAGK